MKKVEANTNWHITKTLCSDSKSKDNGIESRSNDNINKPIEEIKVWKKEQLQKMVRLKTFNLVDAEWQSSSSQKQCQN